MGRSKGLVRPILEWLVWSCTKRRNEGTSAAETDMTVVTLMYQKSKSWHKLWLEEKIGKCSEAQRVGTTQINTGLAVVVAASLSVSQADFFVQGANTAMKMNGAIAGYSATGRKKLTAR